MNKAEYKAYQDAVADFFDQEGIKNLSPGHLRCPNCNVEFEDERCPSCLESKECFDSPFFSWKPCECCKSSLGGNREHATSYNEKLKEIFEYTVCEDCIYYSTYGRLDDMTMIQIEESS